MFKKGCFELGATIHPVVIKVGYIRMHVLFFSVTLIANARDAH